MSHIILIGFKHVGKSAIGVALAKKLNKVFIDLDNEIEKHYAAQNGQSLSCRQIMTVHGEDFFRAKEETVLLNTLNTSSSIIALGGGTPLTEKNQKHIQQHRVILITAPPEDVWPRIIAQGLPAYFTNNEEPVTQFNRLWATRENIYNQLTQQIVRNDTSIDQAVAQLLDLLPTEKCE